MPSPFPGMDPYIEDPAVWPDFHARMITYISDSLGDRLPTNYHAAIDETIRTVDVSTAEGREFIPDVLVRQRHPLPDAIPQLSGVAVADATMLTLPVGEMLELRETRVMIRHYPDQTLIAIVEVLSPTNKTGTGFIEYQQKRREILKQQVHLIEIDLLVGGRRPNMEDPWPAGDYHALVARVETRPKAAVYSWGVRQPLPQIPIPLREPDPDVLLPLAEVFALAYDRGRYARVLSYDKPPTAPLGSDDLKWAAELAGVTRQAKRT